MNKKIIIKQFEFCNSEEGLIFANELIKKKVINQIKLLNSYNFYEKQINSNYERLAYAIARMKQISRHEDSDLLSKQELFLYEARQAKYYWIGFGQLVERKAEFNSRKKLSPLTKLLNIGYHFLSKKLDKEILNHCLWPEIGVLHSYNNNKPLLYDFMEFYRQPLIDKTLLTYIRNKKNYFKKTDKKEIAHFINRIKKHYQVNYDSIIRKDMSDFVNKIKKFL